MPLPINIAEVLRGRLVERERLEFKTGWNPEDVLHTLCAFANDFHNLGGGYLILGVAAPDGVPQLPPAGLDVRTLDDLQKKVVELGHRITPHYHPVMEPYEIDGQHILVLWAPGGSSRPYKAPLSLSAKNQRHPYFIRKGSATVEAKGDDERDLLDVAQRIPFDDRPNQRASLDDLELPLIRAHLRDAGSDLLGELPRLSVAELAERMQIAEGPPEHRWPRNVGLLFFNSTPEKFFPQVQIDVVLLPDGAGGDRIIEKQFTGPLGLQLRDALAYIRNAVIEQVVWKHADRAEADRFFNYPYAAIEEALVNAVYHRSYEEREPIEVRVDPDGMTITSYPGPDRSIRVDDLNAGSFVARRYRNRRIGEFLKELRLTEGRGTGVPKIRRAMERNGSPPAQFATDVDRTWFTAVLPVHPGARAARAGGEGGGQDRGQDVSQVVGAEQIPFDLVPLETPAGARDRTLFGARTGDKIPGRAPVPGRNAHQLNGAERRMLSVLLGSNSLSRIEIAEKLGQSDASGALRRVLTSLLAASLIERTIPGQPNSRHQCYRLTRLGKTKAAEPAE